MKEFVKSLGMGMLLGVIATIFVLLFGFSNILENQVNDSWQKQAIERDYGEFCSRTGEWSWIGECGQ